MESPLPFAFDRQAAAVAPDSAAIRAWGGAQHVFVSSLITDLQAERAAVRLAIQSVGAIPIMFESDLGAQDVPAERAYLDGVRQSGIYVGIFGPRYGVRLASGRSATHDELVEAERLGLRLCVFTSGYGDPAMDREQRDVVDGLRNLYTTSGYSSPDDLHDRLVQRLTDIAAEDILPWVRLGQLFVRAHAITTSGETVAIASTIYDLSILAELKQMEDRRQVVPLASHLDAFDVQAQQVASSVTSAATTEVTVTLSRRQGQGSSSMPRMTMNGVSPDELVTRSLSDGMLGTTLLPQDRLMSLTRPVNPLVPLFGLGLPERSLRPLSQVLLAEFLIRNQHASAVEPVVLGPDHQGSRRFKLTWLPPRSYVNSPASTPITIEGAIRGL